MAYIDVIRTENAEGRLKEIYDELVKTRGKLASVHTIQSLNPESIVKHMDLYMHIMYGKSPLKRVVREMLGVVVSKANQCEYCQKHHLEAVLHYWKDQAKANLFLNDYRKVDLSDEEAILMDLAWELTVNPSSDRHVWLIERLKNKDIEDRAILDATLIIAYFNFVNRMVLGLGVQLEEDPGGYDYD